MIELRAAGAEDLDDLCALINRVELHDGAKRVLQVEELSEELDEPYIDLADDSRLAFVGDDLVGFAWVSNVPSEARAERAWLSGGVHPDHRGQGIGRELLGWSLERATARLRARTNDLPKHIRVDALETSSAHRLYPHFGFTPVRWFEEMARPLDAAVDVPVPDGILIRPWPGPDANEETRRVHNEAFGDHWGTQPQTADQWARYLVAHGTRTDLSCVAAVEATGEIVGTCVNGAYPEDDEVTGRQEAWIQSLGTVRAWRGKGVASALIARSFERVRAGGFSHACLGVDADSPTSANRLYGKLGFVAERWLITHQIDLE